MRWNPFADHARAARAFARGDEHGIRGRVIRVRQIRARHLGPRSLRVQLEPGDYLVKDAGVLLVRVNTVETKGGVRFAGVDAGLNLQNLAAYYRTPFVVAPGPRFGAVDTQRRTSG